MVTIKSNREIELMREAGRIVALAHKAVKEYIKPGLSTKQIDDLVEKVIIENGAIPSFKNYNGFPAAACISINEEVVHGIPNKKTILKEGDIVSVDIGAQYKGYHGDSAWTYACGEISEAAKKLLKGTEESLFKGLEFAKANNRLSDISHAIQVHAESLGFSVVREFVGHGLGRYLHEDPQIPNYGLPHRGIILKPGMTLAIEPMINLGNKEVRVLSDGWTTITRDKSLSAHFEHSILILEDGYEILTKV
ncbi:MAG: type I methionyl aminopeptidase [Candidatus Izemoplasmatales bacterium]|nr:type I methionyl aminopeptidase [Candidatus Izemoplasmatales bacterium]MDD4069038.1 type I methionyl aminopeptidase [Candidatus Izemoplasmatales bacterium]MDY0138587.1 type I methionyl aminopeptidase [Candidatus Izemoplasmatales bacterium]